MASDAKIETSICFFCKKRPTTTTYTDRMGKRTENVCNRCLDRLEVQDALEWGVVDLFPLEEEDRYDEILAWLDEFERNNRHRDHDGWMARSVASARVSFLRSAERYEEALKACGAVERLGFEAVWYRWAAGSAKARILEDLGRHDEALVAFEEAFRHQEPRHLPSARHELRHLVEFSANAGKPVNEFWREVAQNVAAEFDVEFPIRPTLAESILALFDLTEGKPSRRQREATR